MNPITKQSKTVSLEAISRYENIGLQNGICKLVKGFIKRHGHVFGRASILRVAKIIRYASPESKFLITSENLFWMFSPHYFKYAKLIDQLTKIITTERSILAKEQGLNLSLISFKKLKEIVYAEQSEELKMDYEKSLSTFNAEENDEIDLSAIISFLKYQIESGNNLSATLSKIFTDGLKEHLSHGSRYGVFFLDHAINFLIAPHRIYSIDLDDKKIICNTCEDVSTFFTSCLQYPITADEWDTKRQTLNTKLEQIQSLVIKNIFRMTIDIQESCFKIPVSVKYKFNEYNFSKLKNMQMQELSSEIENIISGCSFDESIQAISFIESKNNFSNNVNHDDITMKINILVDVIQKTENLTINKCCNFINQLKLLTRTSLGYLFAICEQEDLIKKSAESKTKRLIEKQKEIVFALLMAILVIKTETYSGIDCDKFIKTVQKNIVIEDHIEPDIILQPSTSEATVQCYNLDELKYAGLAYINYEIVSTEQPISEEDYTEQASTSKKQKLDDSATIEKLERSAVSSLLIMQSKARAQNISSEHNYSKK